MAKSKKPAVSKTDSIKDAMAKHPSLGPKELADKLNSQGVKVSAAYVSTIKSSLRRKAGRSSSVAKPRANGSKQESMVPVEAIGQARELIKKAGDVAKAKAVLDAVAALS